MLICFSWTLVSWPRFSWSLGRR